MTEQALRPGVWVARVGAHIIAVAPSAARLALDLASLPDDQTRGAVCQFEESR